MNSRPLRTVLKMFLFAAAAPLLAVGQANPTTASTPPLPPYVSPEVHADGSATLRLRAPNAHAVTVDLEGKVMPLAQDADGLWIVTSPVLAPEIYGYRFIVDGQPMLDPKNSDVRNNLLGVEDNLTIPGTPPQPWELQSIPHGIVDHRYYTSQVVLGLPNNQSNYYVYTPPGYNPKASQKYPVLYLLHGYSDDADAWYTVGKANFILDSLIASGKAKPMIVVMTLGYGTMAVLKGPRVPGVNTQNYDLYQQALLTEVLPQVEANYRVSKKREDRAIAGLSMGGHESLFVGLAHPELFDWVGTFSAGAGPTTVAELPAVGPQKPRLVWIACGVDDGLLKPNRAIVADLKAKGLPVTAIETPGHHQWPVWRDNLVNFAPVLFQK